VIYKDDLGTICRRWNWKEVDRTKLTEDTHNAVIVIEALPPVSRDSLQQALAELSDLVKKFCGGEVRTTILDNQNPNLTLDK
jgi:DNA/RNA-binding domain of Phe-tRNA-synthetase-like protein